MWIFISTVCFIAVFILYLTVTDFQPDAVESISAHGQKNPFPTSKTQFSFVSWNIGYCGLGKGMDFFYEGGTRVRPEMDEFKKYLSGVCKTISTMDSVDFLFLQEADVHSKRSYFIDEVEEIGKSLPGYCSLFAKNYDSRFVPVPLNEPMGRVVSGIVAFNLYEPGTGERIDFGTRFPWPKQLVFLKRCFIVMKYPLDNGKDLVLVTTHNSTYDTEGKLRKVELKKLQSFLHGEFEKGNFVIAGGDWNNNPRGFNPGLIASGDLVKTVDPPIDPILLKGWNFVFDPSNPTNRDVDAPYRKGKTKTTIIDFYVVSPNIKVLEIKTITNGFAFSDHQPVFLKIELNK